LQVTAYFWSIWLCDGSCTLQFLRINVSEFNHIAILLTSHTYIVSQLKNLASTMLLASYTFRLPILKH